MGQTKTNESLVLEYGIDSVATVTECIRWCLLLKCLSGGKLLIIYCDLVTLTLGYDSNDILIFFFSDTLLSFSRSCYPTSGQNHCIKGVDKELKMDVILCSEFCNTDNCNSAFTSQLHSHLLWFPFSITFILLSGFHDINSRMR